MSLFLSYEQEIQFFWMYCPPAGLVCGDRFLPDQGRQRFLECKRAVRASDRDLLMKMLQPVLPDMLSRSVADHQEFRGRNPASAYARDEDLRHDRCKRHG